MIYLPTWMVDFMVNVSIYYIYYTIHGSYENWSFIIKNTWDLNDPWPFPWRRPSVLKLLNVINRGHFFLLEVKAYFLIHMFFRSFLRFLYHLIITSWVLDFVISFSPVASAWSKKNSFFAGWWKTLSACPKNQIFGSSISNEPSSHNVLLV